MPKITNIHKLLSNEGDRDSEQAWKQSNKRIKVYIRLMFRRIGEIDTLNEKYQAQVAIESRWIADINKLLSNLSPDDQKGLFDGKSISLLNYPQSNWHPQLYIDNALGELKEQIRYTAKKSKIDNQFYICEHRDVKGLFWEKLELQHFPSDVQDLSISIGSMFYDDKVVLLADPHNVSAVNREAFIDQQEWSLYEHVDTEQRFIREFLFDSTNNNIDDDDDNNERENTSNNEDRKRSVLTVTCHAARQSNYFYWNGYCLILLITLISFCIFSIPPNLAANRIQIVCTLLLTSITFRWTVNRSLPTISYLTSLDIYAIICMFSLVIQAIWHALIGGYIFLNTPDNRLTSSMSYTYIDQYVFLTFITLFILMHIVLISWLYLVPLKHRKNMNKKDFEYRLTISSKKLNQDYNGKNHDNFRSFARIPTETHV